MPRKFQKHEGLMKTITDEILKKYKIENERNGKRVRHILGLSGGKDSAALAVYLHDKIPNLEYFFCDTHKELEETYEFLDRLKARLNINLKVLQDTKGFDHWLELYNGFLPSAQQRWCTIQMKIKPLEEFIGDDEAISYVAIRADENREGFISTKPNIKVRYPFIMDGIEKSDVLRILDESGIGMPKYYEWRSRSGCYFCFFQRKYEWVMLSENHPDLFEKAKAYEQKHSDGRTFTWNDGETLDQLVARKEQIIIDHNRRMERELNNKPNKPLHEALADVLNEDDDNIPCLMCTT